MRRYFLPVGLLILAGAVQGNSPDWLTIKGARPDFLLVVLIATALTLDPLSGTVAGFIAGLIHGSIVGSSLGSFIVSRTVIGFLAGTVTIRLFSENPLVPVLAAGGLTFLGETMFLLANPTPDLLGTLNKVLIKSVFNSLLTLIAFWLLTWLKTRRRIRRAVARL